MWTVKENYGAFAVVTPDGAIYSEHEDEAGAQLVAAGKNTEGCDTATLTMDGLSVIVTLERTPDGPLVELHGKNCSLEGEMPGEYYLVPLAAENPDDETTCAGCGVPMFVPTSAARGEVYCEGCTVARCSA